MYQRLVVDSDGQHRSHLRRAAGLAGPIRRVRYIAAGRVRELARAADAVLDGNRLDRVGHRRVDVAQYQPDANSRAAARIERDNEMRRRRGRGARDRHHRVRQLELGDSGGQADSAGVAAVGRDVNRRR
jgi:hypothetical protein